jgi:hypothetical protein
VLVRSRPGPFFSQIPVASGTAAFETDVLDPPSSTTSSSGAARRHVPLGEIEILAHDTFDFGEIALPPRTSGALSGQDRTRRPAMRTAREDRSAGRRGETLDGELGSRRSPAVLLAVPRKYEWLVYRSGQQLRRETFEVK